MMRNGKVLALVAITILLATGAAVWTYSVAKKENVQGPLESVKPYKQPNLEEEYDVVVVGGEPEGVAAAVSAARNGSKTLLIEHRDGLGGLFTYGALNFLDVSKDMNGDDANTGIFKDWHELVGNKIGFDIPKASLAFMKLVNDEKNLTLALNTKLESVDTDGSKLYAIQVVDHDGNKKHIKGKAFIDSTQDGDLAVMAGAPYFKGGADIGLEDRKMAVTLVLHFKNVDWKGVKEAGAKGIFGGGEVNDNVGWGFSGLHYDYKPHFDNTRLRGLNILKQEDGSVYVNALQIFGVDGLDEKQRKEAIEVGKKEAEYVLKFLQKEFPGFEKAELAEFPSELYVRETRHIQAEYQLPMSDLWENKDHWDSIGLGAYPVDVQATSPGDYGYVISDPVQYAIPFRSLVPLKVDGLLVASKAAGYSSVAAGSARVVPTGMTVAEAAGAAADLAIEQSISFREMTENKNMINELQSRLKNQGVNLYEFDIPFPYENEWFYPAVKMLLDYALVVGGYDNSLPVDKPMKEAGFANLLYGVKRVTDEASYGEYESNLKGMRELISDETMISRDKAAQMVLKTLGSDVESDQAWAELQQSGIVDKTIQEKLPDNRELTGKEAYYLAYLLFQKVKE